jgi:hypothetical protein
MPPRPTRPTARRLLQPVALFSIGAVSLSACGDSVAPTSARGRQPAEKLATLSVTALGKVPYVELSGSISAATSSSSLTVTDVVEGDGSAMGTVDVVGNPTGTKDARFTGSVRFVVSDQTTWVDGSKAFWTSLLSTSGAGARQVAALLPKLANHWIELVAATTTTFNEQTGGLIDPRGFAQEFLHDSAGKFSNKGDLYLNGQHVVELTTKVGAAVDLAPSGSALPFEIRTQPPAEVTTDLHYSYPTSETIAPPKHFEYLETILAPYTSKP